ncbi:hypothetical protein ACFX13_029731 [Malus domestica]
MTSSPLTPSCPIPPKLQKPLSSLPTTSRHSGFNGDPNSNSIIPRRPSSPPSFHLPRQLLAEVREGPEDRAPQPLLPETLCSTIIPLLPNY